MDGDEDLDTHICLACQVPILGLDNYVYHKKFSCPAKRRTEKPVKAETSSSSNGVLHAGVPSVVSSDVQLSNVPQLSVFGTHGIPTSSVSHTQIYQAGSEVTSPPQTTLFGEPLTQSVLVTSVPDMGYMQPELSVMVDTHHHSNHTNVTMGSNTSANPVTTFRTTPSRFNVVDPNMVLKHHLPPPPSVVTTENSGILTTTDTNSPPNLAEGNPSILDFLSSLELQCRAAPSQGKAIPGTGVGLEDQATLGEGLDGKMPDGLKIASLLKDLNFDSDSDGFDMPSDAEDLLNFDEDYLSSSYGAYEGGKGKDGHSKGKTKLIAHKGGKKGKYPGKWRPGERPHSAGKNMATRSVSIGKRQYEEMSSDDEHEQSTITEAAEPTQSEKIQSDQSEHDSPSPKKARHPGLGGKEKHTLESGSKVSGIDEATNKVDSLAHASETIPQAPSTLESQSDDLVHMVDGKAGANVSSNQASHTGSTDTASQEYQCEPCAKAFKNRSALHNHIRSEEHKHLVSLTNEEREQWLKQAQEQKNRKEFQCPSCHKDFNSRYNFARHLLSSLHLKKSKTSVIHLNSTFQKLLLRLQPFQCRICQFFCTTAENLQIHLKSDDHLSEVENLVGPMCCKRCQFVSRSQDDMLNHFQSEDHLKKSDLSDRPCVLREIRANLTCQFCDKKIHSATAMQRHLASRHKSLADRGTKPCLKSSVCPVCFKDCKTKYNMQVHMRRSHTHEKPYSCEICKKRFTEQSTFNMHCKSQKHLDNLLKLSSALSSQGHAMGTPKTARDRSKVFKCKDCDFSCSSYSELRPHYIDEHCSHTGDRKARVRSHMCDVCGYRFHSKLLLGKHMETDKHKEKEKKAEASGFTGFACTHCGHKYYSKEKLSLHLLGHMSTRDKNSSRKLSLLSGVPEKFHNFVLNMPKKKTSANKELPCPECNALLKVSNMVVHLRSHGDPKDQPYKCSICSKTFTSNPTLYRHHRSHLGVRPFECNICSKTFNSGPALDSHQLAAHPTQTDVEAKYECSRCNLKFAQKHRYNLHMKYHEKHKQYKCDFPGCNKSFVLVSTLRDHTRVHTGEKPYLCDLCGFATKTQTHMSRHRRVHTGECSYQCHYCTFKASFSWGLRRHMRIHIGCKPYKCPYCEYRCNCQTNLRHHVLSSKRHTGLPIYQCKMCDMGTNNAKEFQQHMIQEHKVSEDEVENIALYAGIYIKDEDTSSVAEGSQVLPVREKKPKAVKTRKKKSKESTLHEQSESIESVEVVTEPWNQLPESSMPNTAPIPFNPVATSAPNYDIQGPGTYVYAPLYSLQGNNTHMTTDRDQQPTHPTMYQNVDIQDYTTIIVQPSATANAELKAGISTQYSVSDRVKTMPYQT